jgi:hypothetical protein
VTNEQSKRYGKIDPRYLNGEPVAKGWNILAPSVGVVRGSACRTRAEALVFIADRRANDEGFPNEVPLFVRQRKGTIMKMDTGKGKQMTTRYAVASELKPAMQKFSLSVSFFSKGLAQGANLISGADSFEEGYRLAERYARGVDALERFEEIQIEMHPRCPVCLGGGTMKTRKRTMYPPACGCCGGRGVGSIGDGGVYRAATVRALFEDMEERS